MAASSSPTVRRRQLAASRVTYLASLIGQPEAWPGTVIAAMTIDSASDGSATGVAVAGAYSTGCTGW